MTNSLIMQGCITSEKSRPGAVIRATLLPPVGAPIALDPAPVDDTGAFTISLPPDTPPLINITLEAWSGDEKIGALGPLYRLRLPATLEIPVRPLPLFDRLRAAIEAEAGALETVIPSLLDEQGSAAERTAHLARSLDLPPDAVRAFVETWMAARQESPPADHQTLFALRCPLPGGPRPPAGSAARLQAAIQANLVPSRLAGQVDTLRAEQARKDAQKAEAERDQKAQALASSRGHARPLLGDLLDIAGIHDDRARLTVARAVLEAPAATRPGRDAKVTAVVGRPAGSEQAAQRLALADHFAAALDVETPVLREIVSQVSRHGAPTPEQAEKQLATLGARGWLELLRRALPEATAELATRARALAQRYERAHPEDALRAALAARKLPTATVPADLARLLTVAPPSGAVSLHVAGHVSLREIGVRSLSLFTKAYLAAHDNPSEEDFREILSDEAAEIHARARSAAALSIAASTLSQPVTPADEHKVDYPAFFGSPDACVVPEAISAVGKAAYLVDLLDFLRGAEPDERLLRALRLRRPDIEGLVLDEGNATTPVPVIDLLNELLEAEIRPRQGACSTTRRAEDLALAPEHLDREVYDQLRRAGFPWSLPFDLDETEASVWLEELGLTRAGVVRALADPAQWTGRVRIARAALGLGSGDRAWLCEPPPRETMKHLSLSATLLPGAHVQLLGGASGAETWLVRSVAPGTPLELAWVQWDRDEEPAAAFLSLLGLDATDLEGLLATRLVQARPHGPTAPALVRDAEDPCDLAKAKIVGLSPRVRDRILYLLRLRSRLGLSTREIDRALAVLGMKGAPGEVLALPGDFGDPTAQARRRAEATLVGLATLTRLCRADLPMEAALTLFSDIETAAAPGQAESQYARLFLDPSRLTAEDRDAFRLGPEGEPEAPLDPDLVRRALGVSPEDWSALSVGAAITTVRELSDVYRRVLLARAAGRSVAETRRLADLLGAHPFASPDGAHRFLEQAEILRAGGLRASDLAFLLDTESPPPEPLGGALEAFAVDLAAQDLPRRIATTFRIGLDVAQVLAPVFVGGLLGTGEGTPALAWRRLQQAVLLARQLRLEATDFRPSGVLGVLPFDSLSSSEAVEPLLEACQRRALRDRLAVSRLSLWEILDASAWSDVAARFGARAADLLAVVTAMQLPDPPARSAARWLQILDALDGTARAGVPAATFAAWGAPEIGPGEVSAMRAAAQARAAGDTWAPVARAARDRVRMAQRAALLAAAGAKHAFSTAGEAAADALHGWLLVDPLSPPGRSTTRIDLAISAVQRLVQRIVLGMEKDATGPLVLGTEARRRWDGIRSYVTWRAHREVFLYPEAWLRPELRHDRSHLFTNAQNLLAQRDLSDQALEDAVAGYVHGLDGIARLEMMGACLEDPATGEATTLGEGKPFRLHLLGRTPGSPHQHFLRAFDGRTNRWTPWQPLELDIDGDWAVPMIRQGRMELYWVRHARQIEGLKDVAGLAPSSPFPLQPHLPMVQDQYTLSWSVRQRGQWSPRRSIEQPIARPLVPLAPAEFAVRVMGGRLRISGVSVPPPPQPPPPPPIGRVAPRGLFDDPPIGGHADEHGIEIHVGGNSVSLDNPLDNGNPLSGEGPPDVKLPDPPTDKVQQVLDDLRAVAGNVSSVLSKVEDIPSIVNTMKDGEQAAESLQNWAIVHALKDIAEVRRRIIEDIVSKLPDPNDLRDIISQLKGDVAPPHQWPIPKAILQIPDIISQLQGKPTEETKDVSTVLQAAVHPSPPEDPSVAAHPRGAESDHGPSAVAAAPSASPGAPRAFSPRGPIHDSDGKAPLKQLNVWAIPQAIMEIKDIAEQLDSIPAQLKNPSAEWTVLTALTKIPAIPQAISDALIALQSADSPLGQLKSAVGEIKGFMQGLPGLLEPLAQIKTAVRTLESFVKDVTDSLEDAKSKTPHDLVRDGISVAVGLVATFARVVGAALTGLMNQAMALPGVSTRAFLNVGDKLSSLGFGPSPALEFGFFEVGPASARAVRMTPPNTIGTPLMALGAAAGPAYAAGAAAAEGLVQLFYTLFPGYPGLFDLPVRVGQKSVTLPTQEDEYQPGSDQTIRAQPGNGVRFPSALLPVPSEAGAISMRRDSLEQEEGLAVSDGAPTFSPEDWLEGLRQGIRWVRPVPFERFPGRYAAPNPSLITDERRGRTFLLLPETRRSGGGRRTSWRVEPVYHPLAGELASALEKGGPDEVFARASDPKDAWNQAVDAFHHSFESTLASGALTLDDAGERLDRRPASPYGSYDWELFFHLPVLLGNQLRAARQYERALGWYARVFDPTAASGGDVAAAWRFAPLASSFNAADLDSGEGRGAILAWEERPFDAHAVAGFRRSAYARAAFLRVVETLVDWGDHLRRLDASGNAAEAAQLYLRAKDLLGPRPRWSPGRGDAAASYHDLQQSGALSAEHHAAPVEGLFGAMPASEEITTILGPSLLCFAAPPHPELARLWARIDQGLLAVRRADSPRGAQEEEDASVAATSRRARSMAASTELLEPPASPYRFPFLLQKALEHCGAAKALGGALQSALASGDGEALARLRQSHEMAMLDAAREVRVLQLREAERGLEAAKRSKQGAEIRLDYYRSREFMNAAEVVKEALAVASSVMQIGVSSGELLASSIHIAPDLSIGIGAPSGVQVSVAGGSSHVANAASAAARGLGVLASVLRLGADLAGLKATYERRQEEWDHQAELAKNDVALYGAQIGAAERRVEIAGRELANHDLQREHSRALDAFYREKFTSQELYDWMAEQLSDLHEGAFHLALSTARQAEIAYRFERADEAFRQRAKLWPGLWGEDSKGLLAAERLERDLRAMEKLWLDSHTRDQPLERRVQLGRHDPAALLCLREQGHCVVDLPERLFDEDHPGHFCRRIREVRLSIPCVAGPHTPVNARLTLLAHAVRIKGKLDDGEGYPEVPGGGDPRFWREHVPVDELSTSSGVEASGATDWYPRDDRYLPFEGAGAVSTWRIELPRETNRFDLDTISDVILDVKYTAKKGDADLRKAAWRATFCSEPPAMDAAGAPPAGALRRRLISARTELSGAFSAFLRPASQERTLRTSLTRDHFQYVPPEQTIEITEIRLIALAGPQGVVRAGARLDVEGRDSATLVFDNAWPDGGGLASAAWVATPPLRVPASGGVSVTVTAPVDAARSENAGTDLGQVRDLFLLVTWQAS